MGMSCDDYEQILELIRLGVLVQFDPKDHEYRVLTSIPEVSLYVGCPDADQYGEMCGYHQKCTGQRFHPIGTIHGGGVGFHQHSPIHRDSHVAFPFDWYLQSILAAARLKDSRHISFYGHAPCNAAGEANMNVIQCVETLLYNRAYLEITLQMHSGKQFEVVPLLHKDYGPHHGLPEPKKRTRLVSRKAWIEVRDRFWSDHLASLPFRLTELVTV